MMQRELFEKLYAAKTEEEVDIVIERHRDVFANENWVPLGGDDKLFGVTHNQQSSPIAALVEKITNSIDAMLTKRCYEMGIQPTSPAAPKSMEEAVEKFFPKHKQWDLRQFRREQAEEIQILADGPPRNTSVIIYDNGEGQHPEMFEKTLLSLLKGNKMNIQFVQGKYNMGSSGALTFCGKKKYQLVGSKRYDNTGDFGFTLIRKRKISESGENARSSHLEYFKINGKIPSFSCGEMDLKLHNRKYKTGTVLKLYSYQFPSGYSGFAQELNQSLNEFLFEPVLPLLTVDKKERYPNNKVLELDLYGLKRRLDDDKSEYVDEIFSEEYTDEKFKQCKVTCYVFKPKLTGRDVKKSKETIRDRFFKNNMAVMNSLNGQVHGFFTSEFITRTLKFNMLKDHLLIHVDCTAMNQDFREELFMGSRDRMKEGDETKYLRDFLGRRLRESKLDEINKKRKESVGLESEDTNELIKSFAKNLPKNSELFRLIQNTLKLDEEKKRKEVGEHKKPREEKEVIPFKAQRFPSKFKLHKRKDGVNVLSVPINGEKIIKFETDVENDYFDRIDEPGNLQLALLQMKHNTNGGGNKRGASTEVSELLNIVKSSPNDGTIKLTVNPTKEMKVGDEVEMKVSLTAPGDPFEEIIWVKVTDPEAPKEKAPKEEPDDNIGLPELKKVNKEQWAALEEKGIEMNHNTVMFPLAEGDVLSTIYVNLDSRVFLSHRAKLKSEDQILTAQKKYLSSVFFHTIFLYMITKNKKIDLSRTVDGKIMEVTIDEYVREVFDSYYSEFLLNFGMEQLMAVVE